MDPEYTNRPEPWIALAAAVETGDQVPVAAVLAGLSADEMARALSRMDEAHLGRLLSLVGAERSADILELLPDVQAIEIIEDLPVAQAAAIVDELDSDDQADVLGALSDKSASAILDRMEPAEASAARLLLQYEPHTAGGLMVTEYLAYRDDLVTSAVVDDMHANRERYADYNVQYAYIVDAEGFLQGVLRLRDLLLTRELSRPVRSIMISSPRHVLVGASLDELKAQFDELGFYGLPVTSEDGRLLGIVQSDAVEEALGERETQTFMKASGFVSAEEIRSMPTVQRSRRRLSWLSINVVLNIISASVIALYQDTLAAVIALAVFLPIISDMSGCSGNQAVAVSIRELSLGLVKPYEYLRVIVKEGSVGLINGVVLGVLLGAAAAAWQSNVHLGLVVGGALALNTVLAVVLGGSIPLVLQSLKLDPALASGPILTTVTDMAGFLMVLSFATAALPSLT